MSGNSLVLLGVTGGLTNAVSPGFFTVMHTGTLTGSVKITMSDGAGGSFWPLSYAADKSVTLSPSISSAVFFYCPIGSAGARSITLSNDSGLGNPAAHAFTATAPVGSATPFKLMRGATTIGSYATLQACKDTGGWQSGDVVKVIGGTYTPYAPTDAGSTGLVDNPGGVQIGVDVADMTIEWDVVGVPAILDNSRAFMVGMWTGGQPRLLTMGPSSQNLTIRGLQFRGARPPIGVSWFGAAIWTQSTVSTGTLTLTMEYCKISNCPDGFKTQDGRYNLENYIRYCVFEDNSDNRGLDHDIYTGKNSLTYVEGCAFRKTSNNPYPQEGMGHFVKSRCRTTTVKACLFDGLKNSNETGGVAQTINTPNGGVVSITGNVILHYGATTVNGKGEPLRYGDDQHTLTVDTNQDPALLTHSLLFAQNTVRQVLGRAADGTSVQVVSIYPTGVATTLLGGDLSTVAVTTNVRNNIASNDTTGAATFLSRYPSNTVVSGSDITDLGVVAGAAVTGSANDATLEWAGDYLVPTARTDTNQGGRSVHLPAWVPATAWQWTDIPGGTWVTAMADNGSGVAPAVTALDPGPSKSYISTWDFSGPAYSKKNHEFWLFGGGHAGTTINAVSRFELHKDTPNVVLVCAPTTEAIRSNETSVANYATYNTTSYWSDGKPHSPHSYTSNLYLDSVDDFVSFGLAAQVGSGETPKGGTLNGDAGGITAIAGLSRAGTWRAAEYYVNFPATVIAYQGDRGLRAISSDESKIYYWLSDSNAPRYGLNKYTVATKVHAYIGGIGYLNTRCTDEHDGLVLILNNTQTAGWVGRAINVTTGAATAQTFTVNGAALTSTMELFDVMWVTSLGYYIAVWVNAGAKAWPNSPGNLTDIKICKLTPTSASAMTVDTMTIATGDGVPTRCSAIRGAFYDPIYQCVMLCLSHSSPLKAIKVN